MNPNRQLFKLITKSIFTGVASLLLLISITANALKNSVYEQKTFEMNDFQDSNCLQCNNNENLIFSNTYGLSMGEAIDKLLETQVQILQARNDLFNAKVRNVEAKIIRDKCSRIEERKERLEQVLRELHGSRGDLANMLLHEYYKPVSAFWKKTAEYYFDKNFDHRINLRHEASFYNAYKSGRECRENQIFVSKAFMKYFSSLENLYKIYINLSNFENRARLLEAYIIINRGQSRLTYARSVHPILSQLKYTYYSASRKNFNKLLDEVRNELEPRQDYINHNQGDSEIRTSPTRSPVKKKD